MKLGKALMPLALGVSLLVLGTLTPTGSAMAANLTYYLRDATVEGFVFVDKRIPAGAEGSCQAELAGRVRFCRQLLSDYKNMQPLEGVSVSFGEDDGAVRTDAQGYFRLTKSWFSARDKQLKISGPKVGISVQHKLEDNLRNFLLITVSQDGRATVFCLDESTTQKKNNRPVVLVDEYGSESVFSIFSASSWKEANDLFTADPDLSKFDFYMTVLRGDRSAVDSTKKLGAFLRMVQRAYGDEGKAIVLAHGMGGLIVRHYTVSAFYKPDTVSRYLMLATPNAGRLIGAPVGQGAGPTSGGVAPDDFMNCLNNVEDLKVGCRDRYLIDSGLQNPVGLNPEVRCAVMAGEVKANVASGLNVSMGNLKDWLIANFGVEAGVGADNLQIQLNKLLDKLPPGDVVVSLKNQLIKDVPFEFLPYAHGLLHRPKDRDDDRYVMMKRFILTGTISETR